MRSTQFDDRSPYEEELEQDWQCATTIHDACGRRQFTRLNSRLSTPPKSMPVESEALGDCRFSAKRESRQSQWEKNTLKVSA
jgi:hypothetical protein